MSAHDWPDTIAVDARQQVADDLAESLPPLRPTFWQTVFYAAALVGAIACSAIWPMGCAGNG